MMIWHRAARSALALVAVALLVGCAGEFPQSTIDPKTDFAHTIHDLYGMITWITFWILVVVWALLAFVLVRFRERPDGDEPKQIHGHFGLEIAWTIVPAIIVVAIAVPTVQATFATQRGDPENAMVVEVIGHQFWWEFHYPQGITTANELHLPVDRPVSLRLHSDDVIHSFWVPMLGGKRDVNPLREVPEGKTPRYTWLHFTIEEEGVYMGQCAEFCGEAHSLMGTRVVAQSEADFQAWISDWQAGDAAGDTAQGGASQPVPDAVDPQLVAEGRELFVNQTCIACHAVQGTGAQGAIGPNLTLMGRRSTVGAGWLDNSVENLIAWITAPQDIKPGALMPGVDEPGGNFQQTRLTPEQVEAIAHYLFSLR